MHTGQDVCCRIDEGEGDAVGHQDHERDVGTGRDEGVGGRDGVLEVVDTPPRVTGAHELGARTMDLLREDHGTERNAEGLGDAGAVHRDVFGVVPDVKREVEEVIGRLRDAAVPRGHADCCPERLGLGPEPQKGGSVGHRS